MMVGSRIIDVDSDKHKSFSEMLEVALSMIAPHQRVILEGRSGVGGNVRSYAFLAEQLGRGLVETDVMVPRIRDAENRALQKMTNVGVFDDLSVAWMQFFQEKRPSVAEIVEASKRSVPLRGVEENIEWAFYILRKVCHIRQIHDDEWEHKDNHIVSSGSIPEDILDPEGWPESVMWMPVDRMPLHPSVLVWCNKYGVKKLEDMIPLRNEIMSFMERPENGILRDFMANQVSLWRNNPPGLSESSGETRFWQALQFSMARLPPESASVLSLRVGYPMGDPVPIAHVAERMGLSVDQAMALEQESVTRFFDNDLWRDFQILWKNDKFDLANVLAFEEGHQWFKGMSDNVGIMLHLAEKATGKHWHVSSINDTLIFSQRNAGNQDGIRMS